MEEEELVQVNRLPNLFKLYEESFQASFNFAAIVPVHGGEGQG